MSSATDALAAVVLLHRAAQRLKMARRTGQMPKRACGDASVILLRHAIALSESIWPDVPRADEIVYDVVAESMRREERAGLTDE